MTWKAGIAFAAGMTVAVAAGAIMPQSPSENTERASCTAQGSTLCSFGTRSRSVCEIPFADAGKACSASTDCKGACTLPDDFVWVMGRAVPTTGTCQARTKLGCMTVLENGLPIHYCVD